MIKPHTIFTAGQEEILRSSKYDAYALQTKDFEIVKERQRQENIRKLYNFISKWRDKYSYFCDIFNCNSWTVDEPYPTFRDYNDYIETLDYKYTSRTEYYLSGFFDYILYGYAHQEQMMRRETSTYSVYQEDGFRGKYFELVSHGEHYNLYMRLCPAIILSLILSMSNNSTILSWYDKSSKFRNFIQDLSDHCGCIEFNNSRINVCYSEYKYEKALQIDVGGYNTFNGFPDYRCGKHVYFVKDNEVVSITENIVYRHLDDLFGKGRTKPLTSEDLELYHMLNGKYPSMYDFDVQC